MNERKLTEEQINDLFLFCEENDVKYYDVQMELVDHLATAIENKWKEKPALSYEEALWEVYDEFGASGFRKIISSKKKELRKKYTQLYQRYLIGFFKLPRIILTIAITYILFIILNHTENDLKIGLNMAGIYLVSLIVFLFILYPKKLRLDLIPGKSFSLHDHYKTIKWTTIAMAAAPLNLLQSINNIIRGSGKEAINWEIELLTAFLLALFFIGSFIMTVYIPRRIKEDFAHEFPQFVKA